MIIMTTITIFFETNASTMIAAAVARFRIYAVKIAEMSVT